MSQQGGEKTEHPTEKRLRDARRRGQVAKSQDLTSSLLLITAVMVLWIAGPYMGANLGGAMADGLERAASFRGELDQTTALAALFAGVKAVAFALLPLLGAMLVVAALVSYLQVGSVFAFQPIKPDLNKLNPAESFKQKFFKGKPYLELGKTIIKIIVAVFVIGTTLWGARRGVIELTRQPAPRVASFALSIIFEIGLKVGLAFLALGAGDFFLQRFLHLKELRMTKQEVKDEYKETEGNPIYKSARRQMHKEILMQSMMAAVKRANVVLVNPTHVAVAVEYDRATMAAPTIVAKGAELMAAQIRELARDSNVPVMRDIPLARALYELELDAEIPEELFEAVAEVLRWVYQLAEERGEVIHA